MPNDPSVGHLQGTAQVTRNGAVNTACADYTRNGVAAAGAVAYARQQASQQDGTGIINDGCMGTSGGEAGGCDETLTT